MKSRILGFAGHKQAGKTTSSNFLHGYQLRAQGIIDNFDITDDGQLVIDTEIVAADGEQEKGRGFLDVKRSDLEFAEWAAYSMWPYIKNYSFADPLKQISTGLFEINYDQAYGTDAQKNTKSIFRWEEMPGVITDQKLASQKEIKSLIKKGILKYHKPGKMSAREFLQFFGTDVCRRIYEDVWQSRLVKDIEAEEPLVAVIDDCRFLNEVESIQAAGGKVIHLTRDIYKDSHSSECALDSFKDFDAVIDNDNLSIYETHIEIIKLLTEWGWLASESKTQPPREATPEASPEPTLVGGIHKFREGEE